MTGLIDFTGWHYGKLQLRSGDRVVIEDSSQFEVPGGSYTLRAVLSSGQTYDVPGSFVVPRRGYVKRDVVIPAGWVEFTFRPPTRSAPCEIWSGQQHIVTLPMRRGEKVFPWFGAELLAGTYRATIRTANGITERAFTVRTGQDEKITIDLP